MTSRCELRFKRATGLTIIASVLAVMLLTACLPAVTPAAGPADSGAVTGSQDVTPKDPVQGRPYYNPELARRVSPHAARAEELLGKFCPQEMPPMSLARRAKPGGKTGGGSVPAPGGGTGGWTALRGAYTPSSDPNVSYYADPTGDPDQPWESIDSNGDRHCVYWKEARTDISQGGDPPGTRYADLTNLQYVRYHEGRWYDTKDITPVSGFEDSDLLLFELDSRDSLHVVYTRCDWGRDPTVPMYQEENQNVWYRFRSPAGAWSEPKRLTDTSGPWGINSGWFVLLNDRIYGAWTETLNRETVPRSYTSKVCFVDGFKGTWNPVRTIAAWDYSDLPGERVPFYLTGVGASPLNGQVTVTYSVVQLGTPDDNFVGKVYAAVRAGTGEAETQGTWSGLKNIASGPQGSYWMSFFPVYYRSRLACRVIAQRGTVSDDPALQENVNTYSIKRSGGEWKSPDNVTDAPTGQEASLAWISADRFDRLYMVFEVARLRWDAAWTYWVPQESSLRYAEESSGRFKSPVTIMDFSTNRRFNLIDRLLDVNGFIHVLFSTFITDGVSVPNRQAVYYSSNARNPGSGGGFSSPEKLSADSDNRMLDLAISCTPDGRVLTTWGEGRVDAVTGAPVAGAVYSRTLSGGRWSERKRISGVKGSNDLLHVGPLETPPYHDYYEPVTYFYVGGTKVGEQICAFETAKFNAATGEYHGFRKYYAETVNGSWSSPRLISDLNAEGWPSLLIDDNNRVHASFVVEDPATDKLVLYSAMQKEPTPPSTTYYFAEGTTRNSPAFEEWLCLQNPGDRDAVAEITYMLENGETVEGELKVPAHTRVTGSVNTAVGPERDVSVRVQADRWLVAERPMYFDYRGWTGGHDVMGSPTTSQVWYFAEGTTRPGFEEYLTLQNPSGADADVDITYMLGDGSTVEKQVVVGKHSRATVSVNEHVGEGKDVSMKVECRDVAIVAERPMYFDYRGWNGGHDVMGSAALSDQWFFAEGTTRSGFDTYLCLQNPNGLDAKAAVTYILGDGSTPTQVVELPATSRQTVMVDEVVGEEKDVSIVVESTAPVLAERPMYFDYHGMYTGGHVVSGVRRPKNSWYFAEGTTRNNTLDGAFEEWISLQNPGTAAANVTLTYMLGDGSVIDQEVTVPAHTRATVDVNNAVGPDKDVSVAVWSDRGVIAERPIYFNYHNKWTGGHVVMGL